MSGDIGIMHIPHLSGLLVSLIILFMIRIESSHAKSATNAQAN